MKNFKRLIKNLTILCLLLFFLSAGFSQNSPQNNGKGPPVNKGKGPPAFNENTRGGNIEVTEDNILNQRVLLEKNEKKTISKESLNVGNNNTVENLKINGHESNSFDFKCNGGGISYKKTTNSSWNKTNSPGKNLIFFLTNSENIKLNLKCLSSVNKPINNINFEESSVAINEDNLQYYSVSRGNDERDIGKNEINNSLSSPKPSSQPTFVDVAYLQLKTIGNLNRALKALGISDTENLFATDSDYTTYKERIKSFAIFINKDSFIDSLEGSVSLKDIGIGTDIIDGLSCQLSDMLKQKGFNGRECNEKIKITNQYNDERQFYKRKEILQKIKNSIYPNYLNFYNGIKSIGNELDGINIPSKLKNNLKDFYNSVLHTNDHVKIEIGYGIGKRKENIKKLIDNLDLDGANLLYLYNFYNELSKSVIGVRKASKVGDVITAENTDKKTKKSYKILYEENVRDIKESSEVTITAKSEKEKSLKIGKEGFRERMNYTAYDNDYEGYLILKKGEIFDKRGVEIPSSDVHVLKDQNRDWSKKVLNNINELNYSISNNNNTLKVKDLPNYYSNGITTIKMENIKIDNIKNMKKDLYQKGEVRFLNQPDIGIEDISPNLDIDISITGVDVSFDLYIDISLNYRY